ncbi:LLM class flavin-dependent oxidoreductase [Gordonia sp. ABSL1-1]|uniref:LLM class flavin-dependent oxidoreductase n=1 Tax=Gordonia sp. ABSL1-1 TaxID=3053923 RepID=UPI002572F9F3|nr:LLM class flavin-dependent oxidoreductase [Gordonia sp. ABSL1-1]MDL9936979.1 LLM class flavin-dependent oxidoreductase [Gordonia sp. ABSL1-1]
MTHPSPFVAVALRGTGWHPAAWRDPSARPTELLSPRYWTDVVAATEATGADLLTLDDGFAARPADPHLDNPGRTDVVTGRGDSVLIAARVAPTTSRIGILPTVTTTHTEPFHTAKSIATLDYIGYGRAGVLLDVDPQPDGAALFGRRDPAELTTDHLYAEADEYADVLGLLWDSWSDDAEIRDITTGRFVDRNKLHHINFRGRYFSVRGPSITPRPPQGRPVIAGAVELAGGASANQESAPAHLARTDVAFIAATEPATAARGATQIRSSATGPGQPPIIFADLLVHLDESAAAARARRSRLDDLAGFEYTGGATVFAGTPADLTSAIAELTAPGTGIQGVRLRPASIPDDLAALAGFHRPISDASATTLRARLGLPRAENHFDQTATLGSSR